MHSNVAFLFTQSDKNVILDKVKVLSQQRSCSFTHYVALAV